MNQRANISAHFGKLFPSATEELLRLFQAAEDNASFLWSDFQTISDWLEVAGYEQETLHVLLLLLILAQEEGSLCIELAQESLTRRLADLTPREEAASWAQRLLADLGNQDFGKLIGSKPDDHLPVIRHDADGRCFLYFQKYLRHEQAFFRLLSGKLVEKVSDGHSKNVPQVIREVLDKESLRPGGRPLVLDPEQRRALELALSRMLTVISGGPGTGKTSVVLSLVRCFVRLGITPDRIALAAPTGRAAQRLADAMRQGLATLSPNAAAPDASIENIATSTLHTLLEYVPSRDQFRRHAENPVEADVVIVDEVSMVGIVLMAKLFEAVGPNTRIILLGDKDQLPSVDAGAVLANLVPDPGVKNTNHPLKDAVVLLQTNHRSETQIREVAAAINQQDIGILDRLQILDKPGESSDWSGLASERGVRLLEQKTGTAHELRWLLQHWAEHAFIASGYKKALAECAGSDLAENDLRRQDLLIELFRLLDQTRLLTLVRDGPWGCVAINRFMDRYLRPRFDKNRPDELFVGAPVLVTRNDPTLELYNGDVGITLPGPDEGLRVVFPRQGAFLSFPADALPAHELGFALTVHKSQGSEYGQVLLVFPPTGGRRLLTTELVYTGITRAKELAVLCVTREVLRLAVQKKCLRESGIMGLQMEDPNL
jgi:exodeoxyribonuclease V alpha subunit